MKNGSFFVPREQINAFCNPAAMNAEEGLYLYWQTDPAVARRILPPQLELLDPAHPLAYCYVVNIREPTFAPWYLEAGIGLMARFGDMPGLYFCNLQLTGPGAQMGMLTGRVSGLPKKLCERIVVERNGDWAHALVEAKGRRIFDVEIEIGEYNIPEMRESMGDVKPGGRTSGGCFLFTYEQERAADGHVVFPKMTLMNYDSYTVHETYESATITSLQMEPSLDDPWAELAVVQLLGAVYSRNDNVVNAVVPLAEYRGDEADELFSYLFSGQWDRSTILADHQRYP